jgi:hypothetical protein
VLNDLENREHTYNDINRLVTKGHQINVTTQSNHHQSLKLTVVMMVVAAFHNL